jgi:hypothetical protein
VTADLGSKRRKLGNAPYTSQIHNAEFERNRFSQRNKKKLPLPALIMAEIGLTGYPTGLLKAKILASAQKIGLVHPKKLERAVINRVVEVS